jgi:hypothetical protein
VGAIWITRSDRWAQFGSPEVTGGRIVDHQK